MFVSVNNAYGHGLGLDTIPSFDVYDKKVSIVVELPMSFDDLEEKQITITTKDETDKAENVTLLIGIFHQGEMILRDHFFTKDGILAINVKPTEAGNVEILGQQDDLLGAWHTTKDQPLEIMGPIFKTAGLYTFEIELKTIDDQTILKDQKTHRAHLSVIEIAEFNQNSAADNVQFQM